MDDPLSHYFYKEQFESLNIFGNPEVVEPCMFGNGMYFSVFYCQCCAIDISIYMSDDQVLEERYPDLNEEEGIRMD